MVRRYLLDASALYPLVLKLGEGLIRYSNRFAVLDITIYEVGNTIWKEFRRGRIKNVGIVCKLFEEVFNVVHILRPQMPLDKVVELAVSENLTFYDAAYLYVARAHGVKLVTEDSDLQRFSEAINTDQLLKELQAVS